MEYGVNMPGSKIDDLSQFRGDSFWGKVCMKLKKLREAIEIHKDLLCPLMIMNGDGLMI